MGFNVSMDYNLQLEHKESLKNTAKTILNNSGASSETAQKIIEKSIFEGDRLLKEQYTNPQMAILKDT